MRVTCKNSQYVVVETMIWYAMKKLRLKYHIWKRENKGISMICNLHGSSILGPKNFQWFFFLQSGHISHDTFVESVHVIWLKKNPKCLTAIFQSRSISKKNCVGHMSEIMVSESLHTTCCQYLNKSLRKCIHSLDLGWKSVWDMFESPLGCEQN